jgi:hypothetical protein
MENTGFLAVFCVRLARERQMENTENVGRTKAQVDQKLDQAHL